MMDERRFDDEEVAAILQRAAEADAPGAPARASDSRGMTLAQLQEIGTEVGIDPARIAAAADALARPGLAPAGPRLLGVPRSVTRSVAIPRPLTEDEWTRLVVDLRETFGAQGRITQTGTLRTWSNGNLQVHVEPEGDHYRVRMRTVKGNAPIRITMGSALIITSFMMLVSGALADGSTTNLVMGSLFGLGGIAQIGATRAMLRNWASRRAAQMEGLATRIAGLLGRGTAAPSAPAALPGADGNAEPPAPDVQPDESGS